LTTAELTLPETRRNIKHAAETIAIKAHSGYLALPVNDRMYTSADDTLATAKTGGSTNCNTISSLTLATCETNPTQP